MAENIPDLDPSDNLPNIPPAPHQVHHHLPQHGLHHQPPQLDINAENPPEPDNASIRAERGSPTPSSVTVDNAPSLPDRSLLVGVQVADPYNDIPEVPVPSSSALSISSQALSDPAPSAPGAPSRRVQENVPTSSNHPIDPQEPSEVNLEFFTQLLDLGFDEFTARLSLKRTSNLGVEQAVSWIVERSNLSDFEDGASSTEDEEEDEEMGASQSGESASGVVGELRSINNRGRHHKMVLVANMSLKMGAGKLAAQVGHATLGVYRSAMNSEQGQAALSDWTRRGQVKIVVKGQSTEQLMDLVKVAKDAGCFYYLVQDAGYTQIPAGSRTVLGVFGTVDEVDAVTGGLKLL